MKKSGTLDGFWWSGAAFPTSLLYQLHAVLNHKLPAPKITGVEPGNVFDIASFILTLSHSKKVDEEILSRLANEMFGGLLFQDEDIIVPTDARLQAPAAFPGRGASDETCRDLHGIFTLATCLKAVCALAPFDLVLTAPQRCRYQTPPELRLDELIARGHAPKQNDINREICSLSDGYPLEYSFRLADPTGHSERFTTRLGHDKWAEPWRYR